ncbi:MAG: hypothetical protein IKC11_02920 [Clostridia bacterium]|nr:hypothetical protein [Clostridia bacterium]
MLTKEELATHRAIQRLGQKIPDLSLRDLFASSFLQGIISNPNYDFTKINEDNVKGIAKGSYLIADAMLEAREKK